MNGTNWTYCGIFGVIFEGYGYTQRQIALLGLVGNVTVAVSSNLGTLIKNRFGASNIKIISILNIIGLVAAVLLMASRHIALLSNLIFVIVMMVLVQIGFCSFTSLAFMEMEESGISSVSATSSSSSSSPSASYSWSTLTARIHPVPSQFRQPKHYSDIYVCRYLRCCIALLLFITGTFIF